MFRVLSKIKLILFNEKLVVLLLKRKRVIPKLVLIDLYNLNNFKF